MSSDKKKEKKKHPKFQVFLSLASFFLTFYLLYLILQNIELLRNGDSSNNRILYIVFECIALFVIPFAFNPQVFLKKYKNKGKIINKMDKDKFDLHITKLVKFDSEYSPSIIVKCPKCGFDNPSSTKICFNCLFHFDF